MSSIPHIVQRATDKLDSLYLEAQELGDSGVCTLVSAALVFDRGYAEIRERFMRISNWPKRKPIDVRDGSLLYNIHAGKACYAVWKSLLPMPPYEKYLSGFDKEMFAHSGWPLSLRSKFNLYNGAVVVFGHSSTHGELVHMTPVVRGWTLDPFGFLDTEPLPLDTKDGTVSTEYFKVRVVMQCPVQGDIKL